MQNGNQICLIMRGSVTDLLSSLSLSISLFDWQPINMIHKFVSGSQLKWWKVGIVKLA